MKSSLLLASVVLSALYVLPASLYSQDWYWIGDEYSGVQVTVDEKGGRFFFTSGNSTGRQRYLYGGSSTDATVTSNVVFRLQRPSGDQWFTNNPDNFFIERPMTSQGEATFAPFDSLYISPGEDTLEVIWKNLGNTFFIKQRFVVEGPRHEYDNGSDILLEYEYRINQNAPAPANLGIFLMLDQDNRFFSGGSDDLPLLTDGRYFPTDEVGGLFQKRFNTMPEYYLVGQFEYDLPIVDNFSVHRLRGTSLRGAPLTEPDELAVGRWQDFRKLSWLINGDVTSKGFSDLATAMRWENLGTGGMIRTAFGSNSREGNNFYTCRDSNIFVVIRTERVVRQTVTNGPYEPASFDIEMWVTNLHRALDQEIEIGFDQPFGSFPEGTGRLRLDPSSPAIRPLVILPRQTKKLTWRANVNPNSGDTLVELNVVWRDSVRDATPLLPLRKACRPRISFVSADLPPPPPDERDPVIEEIANGRDDTRWWTFRTFDRHPGYRYDSGLDRIEIVQNDGNNMRLVVAPDPFDRCDTNETVNLRFEVVDTTKSALLAVRVYDCEGNSASVQRAYTPRPDIFVPQIVRVDSVVQYDPVGYPCAVPVVQVTVKDTVQTADAGDIGFGTVTMLDDASRINVLPLEVNYHRQSPDINPGDREVRFRITVADTMLPAQARVVYTDLAGNADTFDFIYCPLPDTAAPVFSVEAGSGPTWTLEGSDTASWDRGLYEVVEISGTNMTTDPLPGYVSRGDRAFRGLGVTVVDDAWPAEITLELRDSWYDPSDPSTHDEHSTRLTLTWPGIPDTLAPVITITRDLSVSGSEVVFNVVIVDSHEVAGEPYRYDRGIEEVSWRLTPNMRIRTPLSFSDNRRQATFDVEVIDLFAVTQADTICVSAVDSAGNVAGESCMSHPIEPDEHAPIFRGRINSERTLLTGQATDIREKDRGLFELSLRNTTNIDPAVVTNLDGQSTAEITATVMDPDSPIAGEVVVRDLHDELEGLSEDDGHTTVIPFSLPVVVIELTLPRVVEGGDEFRLHLVSQSSFSGSEVSYLSIPTRHTSNGIIVAAGGPRSVNSMQARSAGGITTYTIGTNSGFRYEPGDTLGTVVFRTESPEFAEVFSMTVDHSSIVSNVGEEDTIRVWAPGDSVYSELILPPPATRVIADSQTVINGNCVRLLFGGEGLARSSEPEILGAYPNPAEQGAGSIITLYVRDHALDGGSISLLDTKGNRVTTWWVERRDEGVTSLQLMLPSDLPAGTYYFRLDDEPGTSAWPIIVR